MLTSVQSFLEPWLLLLSQDPTLRQLQLEMLVLGVIVIFLVFYVTRDVLHRTHSFPAMFLSILLTAGLPVIGFFLYMLLRPARTIAEKDDTEMLREIIVLLRERQQRTPDQVKGGIVKKKKRTESKGGDVEL